MQAEPPTPDPTRKTPASGGWLSRSFLLHPGEGPLLFWACLFFFCLMSSYFIIQPIRDEMVQAHGVEKTNTLVQIGLITMVFVHIAFSGLVSRLSRKRFVPLLYHFFAANLLAFFLVMRTLDPARHGWLAQSFFVWVGIFNLFILSVFWGVMADVFRHTQAARLFGLIGAAGTLGGIVGPQLTSLLVSKIGIAYMLPISMLFLEGAVLSVSRLWRARGSHEQPDDQRPERQHLLSGALEGMKLVLRSPYLMGICAYLFFYSATGMVFWTQKQHIVAEAFENRADRIQFFSSVVTWNNSATILLQLFFTSRILRNVGSGVALAAVPVVTGVGFALLGHWPTLGMIVAFEVSRKVCQYAAAKPAQQLLYTVVGRSEKFKSKTFIDTFVYRGGDSVASAGFDRLVVLGASLSSIAYGFVPLALLWMGVGLVLGRQQKRLAAREPGNASVRVRVPG